MAEFLGRRTSKNIVDLRSRRRKALDKRGLPHQKSSIAGTAQYIMQGVSVGFMDLIGARSMHEVADQAAAARHTDESEMLEAIHKQDYRQRKLRLELESLNGAKIYIDRYKRVQEKQFLMRHVGELSSEQVDLLSKVR